jgi:hypothetical protein
MIDGQPNQQILPTQDQQAGINHSDSSGPVFSMYSKIAAEEDDKTAERWKADAEGILIFVRLRDSFNLITHQLTFIDRPVLRCRRDFSHLVAPRFKAKPS